MKEEGEFDDTNSNDEDEDEKHQSDVIAEGNESELRESECNLAFCSADYERLSWLSSYISVRGFQIR